MTTIKELREKHQLVCQVLCGSRAYGTDFDSSDTDLTGVYFFPYKEFIDRALPKTITEHGNTYFELSRFGELLLRGDLKVMEMILSPAINFKFVDGPFYDYFSSKGMDFICYEVLNNWLVLSTALFNRSQRVGKIVKREVNILDYIHFINASYTEQKIRTFTQVIEDRKLDYFSAISRDLNLDRMGLKPLGNNLFALFEDYGSVGGDTTGLLDAKGDLIKEGVLRDTASVTYRGILYFDEKAYKRHKDLRSSLASSQISNGFSTKSMYHAFRILELIEKFMNYGRIVLKVEDKEFIMQIRRGEKGLEELTRAYTGKLEHVNRLLKMYDGPKKINTELIKDLIYDCRKRLTSNMMARSPKELIM